MNTYASLYAIKHLEILLSILKYELEDKFWPPAAVAVNVQSLLHANSRYLLDVPPAQGISEEAKVT